MLKKLLSQITERGLPLPHAHDPATKKPSFRLLTAYISFLIACGSIITLHFYSEMVIASAMSILFFGVCMVFYMLRRLDSAHIDFDDKEISINTQNTVDKY